MKDTLGDFVRGVIEANTDCEVDPARLNNNNDLESHQAMLTELCQTACFKVINSHAYFPRYALKDLGYFVGRAIHVILRC